MSAGDRPDRAPPLPGHDTAPATVQPTSLGALEWLLPLWHRRWRLLIALLLGALLGLGAAMLQPVRFTASASVVVQPALRPSAAALAGAQSALAGLVGGGGTPADLYATLLRSQAMSERILDRFDLQRSWGLEFRTLAHQQLARRVSVALGRRDGLLQITVVDETPQRAAAIANQTIVELRSMLQAFALDEARQRRQFYDAQLARARADLAAAQQRLQKSGFDRAALRAQPAAVGERYARAAAEVAAAELRLAATRRVRAEASAEVQQQLAEVAGLRQQLSAIEAPRDQDAGAVVNHLRDFRQAEAVVETLARQAEAARIDEATEAVPLQLLDVARPPEWPSSPRLLLWPPAGGMLALAFAAAWVLMRHRQALARLDGARQQRLALLKSVLQGER